MKILVLNPFVDAAHEVVTTLQKKGAAVLVPTDVKEAWELLQVHSSSVDLLVVHREDLRGQGQPGLELIQRLKNHPSLQATPYVLSTAVWNDSECVKHQGTDLGANAYLHWPFNGSSLSQLVDGVLGAVTASTPNSGGMVLESHDSVFAHAAIGPRKDTMSIILEAPDLMGGAKSGAEFEFAKQEEDAATKVLQEMLMPALDEPVAAESVVSTDDAAAAAAESTDPVLTTAPPESSSSADGGGIAISLDAMADSDSAQIETSQRPNQDAVEISTSESTGEPAADEPAGEAISLDGAELAVPAEGSAFDPSLLKLDDEPGATSEPSQAAEVIAPAELSAQTLSVGEGASQSIPDIASQEPVVISTGADTAADPQAAAEMPYIYTKERKSAFPLEAGFPVAVDDAVVPGGAANSPDAETLKKYLLLRENDVSSLSAQLRAAREQIRTVDESLKVEKARAAELAHLVGEQKKKVEETEQLRLSEADSRVREIEEYKFQLKAGTDKAKLMERQVREAIDDLEKVKERVRIDIRKIRVREKELENRLEIMKKDSEVLLTTRENKIIELKRKVDLLEFNMDLLQDQLSKEKDNTAQLRSKLTRASQAVRLAGGLLDSSGNVVFDISGLSGDSNSPNVRPHGIQSAEASAATVVMDPTEVTKRAS